jgi:hypothetical protein
LRKSLFELADVSVDGGSAWASGSAALASVLQTPVAPAARVSEDALRKVRRDVIVCSGRRWHWRPA